MHGEDEDGEVRLAGQQAGGGLGSARVRHGEVGDDHVGPGLAGDAQELLPAGGLADQVGSWLAAQDRVQAVAVHGMVVGDHDPDGGHKGLLVRNLEHLSPAQFAKIMDTLGGDRRGQEILAAWIGKKKLRDVLNLRAAVTGSAPCERDVRDRLFRFYHWCAGDDDVPELLTLARTRSRWEDELVSAVLTGVTNARSESPNRIAKLEARLAYSFRNPANQCRRVRIACTRGTRRSQNATTRQPRLVTGRKHDPG